MVNLIAAYLLHGDHENDLNMRGAWLHVMGDALGSLTAIIAGILIIAFGWIWADAASSVLISLIIIFGAWRFDPRIGQCSSRRHAVAYKFGGRRRSDSRNRRCRGVHDLHVWTITSGLEALAHVVHRETIRSRNF